MARERDVVLFLGAGFSADAGLPTMARFGEDSADELEDLKELQKADRANQNTGRVDQLVRAGERFTGFQEHCSRAGKMVTLDVGNMETLFCIAECLRESDQGLPSSVPGSVSELLSEIRSWLWKIYHRCEIVGDDPLREPYGSFFKTITRKEIRGRLCAITTNYDLVFEHGVWQSGSLCAYPGFDCDRRELDTDQHYLADCESPSSTLLCKLHGSVNYFSQPDDAKLAVYVDVAGIP